MINSEVPSGIRSRTSEAFATVNSKIKGGAKVFKTEVIDVFDAPGSVNYVKENWNDYFHIPYFPPFHKPGWLLRYIVGPHDSQLFERLYLVSYFILVII